jgi:hypothetical protein
MCASPTQDQVDRLAREMRGIELAEMFGNVTEFTVAEADALYESALKIIERVERTPVWLLRAALDEAEGDGLYSQGATFAAQAIDAAYPEFGGEIEGELELRFERLNEQSRTVSA